MPILDRSRLRALSFSVALPALLLPGLAGAQTAPVTQLDAVSITGTRSEKPIGEETGTVTVIQEKDLQRRSVHRPQDAVRYEPGVNVGNQPTRAGQGAYTIRGIGGNRVRVQVDGVKLPDYPASNPAYTRDTVDFDSLKRLEILRGPGSALYGSDALGGVVSYVTKDPSDYLNEVGRDWYVGGRANYDSADKSFGEGATAAGRVGAVEGLLNYTRRDGHEVKNKGAPKANPQDYSSDNLLGKLQVGPKDNRFRLTGEYLQRETDTNVATDRSATVLDSKGEDLTRRFRISLDHTYARPLGFIDQIDWKAYYTRASREEVTKQQRLTSGVPAYRFSDLDFTQDIYGGEVQAKSSATWFGMKHAFTYGVSLDETKTERPRNRYERNLRTGAVTQSFSGGPGVPPELFPNKTFPDTKTVQAGAYVQDEITTGAWTILPAVRFDYYKLTPSPDQAYANTNYQNFVVREFSDTAVSPKLGATYKIDDRFTLFGQYAHGFRAPPYDDANIGFTNGPSRYEILPNANLKPEESDGVEAGLRGKFKDGSSFAVSGFYNAYTDFIESTMIGTRQGITQYQSRNVSKATIWGFEARGEYRFLPDWGLIGSLAYAHGTNDDTDRPLDNVAPLILRAGLTYDHPTQNWGASVTATHYAEKSRVSDPSSFKVPSATTLDLAGYWDVSEQIGFTAGVYNLFDKKYYNYLDVSGFQSNRADMERYTQPGRTFMVGLTARW
ncbi:TonB-dependent hemoglobin/transferrin/lactoferrin family receptor [Elstera cyanobacteriorum]|uniref:TonB-dependent hemoglobin/transferrin/lactoferrin family receptor n=1 Tax=Elstera cyanobacteriorum TaxID=2022747 RepID=UPI002353F7C9|nr:TonB-dependent hemoglobin/transferrin/lactoferrin family receptor [Elstera cyanobacteriorum]MCK6441433.1 TonB-dependent hemoglobin/transferrin/lactoferrin family receptor [Elstera cyanobacteriorum]